MTMQFIHVAPEQDVGVTWLGVYILIFYIWKRMLFVRKKNETDELDFSLIDLTFFMMSRLFEDK